ncbi:hypothetical protein ACGYTU_31255, partial [Burkholderia pseudomallei]
EFVLRGHGRLQHHAIKKQKPPTWRGFVSNLSPDASGLFFFLRLSNGGNDRSPGAVSAVSDHSKNIRNDVYTGSWGAQASWA